MPGVVLECVCGKQFRVGYSELAVNYAANFREGQGTQEEIREQLIEEFFKNNPSILRSEPDKCPSCGAARKEMKVVHRYQ